MDRKTVRDIASNAITPSQRSHYPRLAKQIDNKCRSGVYFINSADALCIAFVKCTVKREELIAKCCNVISQRRCSTDLIYIASAFILPYFVPLAMTD